jgi:threonine/homoserine/homoserine lactone efflux protein
MIHRLILVFFLNILAAISPGPDFAIVLNNTLKKGRLAGIATSLGIFCALFIHCSYCSLGLTHLLLQYRWIMKTVSMVGGLYLLYMGAMIIKNRYRKISSDQHVRLKKANNHASFIQGFLTCLLNPKAAMFIIALFTTLIKPVSIAQGYLFTLCMIVPAFLWFIALSCLLTTPKAKAKLIDFQNHVLFVMGLILIVIGCAVLGDFIFR